MFGTRPYVLALRSLFVVTIALVYGNLVVGQNMRALQLVEQGKLASSKGDALEAVSLFTKAIKADSLCYTAYFGRGVAYYDLSEFQLAIRDYDQALELNDDNPSLYMNRANALSRSARYAEAMYDHRRALHHGYKADDTLLYNMGNNFWRMGELDSALVYFDRALQLNPSCIQAEGNRAFVHLLQGRFGEAEREYGELSRRYPNESKYKNNQGYAELRLGKLDSAETHIRAALVLDPANEWGYRNRALLHMARNERESACSDLELAIQKDFIKKWGRGELVELMSYCEIDH
jgi:Flp pilus assembly protein TadD